MSDELDLSYMININKNNIQSIFNSYQNECSNLYDFNFFNPMNQDAIEQLINGCLNLTDIFITDTDNNIKIKFSRVINVINKIYTIIFNIITTQFADLNDIIYIDKIYNNLEHIQISSDKSSINKYNNSSYYININYKDIIDENTIDDEYLVLQMLFTSSILPTITNDDLSIDAYNSIIMSIISNPIYLHNNSIQYPIQSATINYNILRDGIINSKYNINYYNQNNYKLYFSGTSNSDATKGPIGLFVNSSNSYGSFRTNKYNTTGSYIKSNDGLDYIIDKFYEGEWFILKLEKPICITYYEIIAQIGEETSAPSIWRVYGSIDGTIWILLDDVISSSYNNRYHKDLNSQYTQYSYICLVVKAIYANNNGKLIFSKFNIYGNEITSITDFTSNFPIIFNKNITTITSDRTNIDYSINKFINNNFYNLINFNSKNVKELLYLYNSFYIIIYFNILYLIINNENIRNLNNIIEKLIKYDNIELKEIKKNSIGSLIEIQKNNKTISQNKAKLNLNINNYNKLYDYHKIVKKYSYLYYIIFIILVILILLIDNSNEISINNKKNYYIIITIFIIIFYLLIYYLITRNNYDYKIESFEVPSSSYDSNELQKIKNEYFILINKLIIYINAGLTKLSSKNISLDTNNVIEKEKNIKNNDINLINNKNNNINSANNIMNEDIELMLIINLSLFYGFLIFICMMILLLMRPVLSIYIIIISITLYLLLIIYSYTRYKNNVNNDYSKKYWTT